MLHPSKVAYSDHELRLHPFGTRQSSLPIGQHPIFMPHTLATTSSVRMGLRLRLGLGRS